MRTIILSLARATDRREKMKRQCDAAGLAFELLDATDGRTLTDAERALVDHERRRRITPYPLTDNEIGCWLSHRRAMQSIIARGEKMAVILEDDAEILPGFAVAMDAIERQAGPFDVIDLHRKFKHGEAFVPCRELAPDLSIGRVGAAHMGAIAYVMSRAGAEKFIAYAQKFVHAVDKEMHRYWASGLDIYGLSRPMAVSNDGGHSFLDETRGHDRPQERLRYPDADRLYWRLWRRWTRLEDSVQKRLIWPGYVRMGKRRQAS